MLNDNTKNTHTHSGVNTEKDILLYQFNKEITTAPGKSFLDLFYNQVKENPQNIILQFEEQKCSYQQLNKKSSDIAYRLLKSGVNTGSVIAVLMDRSIEMMITIIGILKAGCSYLPIDPNYPDFRISYILKDSNVQFLIASKKLSSEIISESFEGSCLVYSEIDRQNISNTIFKNISLDDLAYVIYTSASTGNPKGVMITHSNLANFLEAMKQKLDFAPGKTLLMLAPISFDLSISETLLPIATGVKVIIANKDEQNDPYYFNKCIIENKVDIVHCTPSRLQAFLTAENNDWIKHIKELIIGGEEFTANLFNTVNKLYTGRLFNIYGPTEATVWTTIKELSIDPILNIGKPLLNYSIFILDTSNNLTEIGTPGELCIGGLGVAAGYLNNLELTQQKFISNPFGSGKIYRSGDLAKWTENGDIEFLGRIDNQIKIRGFRIELKEIQDNIQYFPNISECVICTKETATKDKVICAYITSKFKIDVNQLKIHLSQRLPDYMIPSYINQVNHIPINLNGKIDYSSLPFYPEGEYDLESATVIEEQLRIMWQEVLGIKIKNLDVDFFELSGHSLSAIILLNKIYEVYRMRIPLSVFFEIATIKKLSNYIELEA